MIIKEYILFSDEQKHQANTVDLEDYLLRRGEKLLPSGRDKRLATNHSVTIRGSEWFDHDTQQGGHAIDFVRMHDGCSFQEAVAKLLGGEQGTDFSVCVGKKRGTTEALCAATPPPQYAPGVCLPYEAAAHRPGYHHPLRAGGNAL